MRKKEILAEYASLQRGAAGILNQRNDAIDTRDRAIAALHNTRERLQYEHSVITSSLHSIEEIMADIDFLLGVSGFIPPESS